MKTRIVRIRSRETIGGLAELFKRACAKTAYESVWPYVVAEAIRTIELPTRGVFVAFEEDDDRKEVVPHSTPDRRNKATPPVKAGGIPRGLALVLLPESPLMLVPQVPLVYSDSRRPAVVRALFKAVTRWLADEGYHVMWSMAMRHKTAAWERRFRGLGSFRILAPLVEVRF